MPKRENEDEMTLEDILKNPEVKKAINKAVDTWASMQPEEMKLKFRALHIGVLFSAFIFAGIGYLGWLGVISKEVTAGLLGTLIGYWYGQKTTK